MPTTASTCLCPTMSRKDDERPYDWGQGYSWVRGRSRGRARARGKARGRARARARVRVVVVLDQPLAMLVERMQPRRGEHPRLPPAAAVGVRVRARARARARARGRVRGSLPPAAAVQLSPVACAIDARRRAAEHLVRVRVRVRVRLGLGLG